jgi:1,4-dihydroxy-2-naphthoate polyprenyltransferase
MLKKSTFRLLRFPFSLFLAPVYFFALSMLPDIHWPSALLVFFILHVLVYPASNGYNSYMDRDETPVGGLADPPQPEKELFYVTLVMDAMSTGLGLMISPVFCFCILAYILASRAYSFRGIRLKRFPVIGYLTVILFQGGLTFFMVYHGAGIAHHLSPSPYLLIVACLLIGGFYPLTQIYQHEADRKDGVRTISAWLGYRGTFIFCGIIYTVALAVLGYYLWSLHRMRDFFVLATLWMPVALYFMTWAGKVWKDPAAANFNNTMRMNIVASLSTSVAFLFLLTLRYFE